MAYKYKYTNNFTTAFNHYLDYLLYSVGGTGSIQAATNFLRDFDDTISLIADFPFGFTTCEDLDLPNEQKIHFRHLKYKIFYHIENNDTIIVDLICHDSQDYKKLF